VKPVAIKITDHLVERDAAVDMPMAHDFKPPEQGNSRVLRDGSR
jgi:hypothetical protein